MNKNLQTLIVLAFIGLSFNMNAQNWQYVGAADINNTTSFVDAIAIPDMEIAPNGDILLAYAEGISTTKDMRVALFTGGTWTQLTSPGQYAASLLNIAMKGTDYYFAYSTVISSKSYVFVKKYNGSNAWIQIGDSMLIGQAGNTNFEFLLDTAGVPTILGVVANVSPGTDKQVWQYNGTAWTSVITLAGSGLAGTVFLENSAAFDSHNNLYCVTQGFGSNYFTLVHKITGTNDVLFGDTLFNSISGNNQVRIDPTDEPYVIMHNSTTSRILAYMLMSTTWSLISDTTMDYGTLYSADLADNGKLAFYTLSTGTVKIIRYASGGSVVTMDTVNTAGTFAGVGDLVIPHGSTDVYVAVQEITPSAKPDISVMKHSLSTGIKEISSSNGGVSIYPNPANNRLNIHRQLSTSNSLLIITDILGNEVHRGTLTGMDNSIAISTWSNGVYFYEVRSENTSIRGKFVKE